MAINYRKITDMRTGWTLRAKRGFSPRFFWRLVLHRIGPTPWTKPIRSGRNPSHEPIPGPESPQGVR